MRMALKNFVKGATITAITAVGIVTRAQAQQPNIAYDPFAALDVLNASMDRHNTSPPPRKAQDTPPLDNSPFSLAASLAADENHQRHLQPSRTYVLPNHDDLSNRVDDFGNVATKGYAYVRSVVSGNPSQGGHVYIAEGNMSGYSAVLVTENAVIAEDVNRNPKTIPLRDDKGQLLAADAKGSIQPVTEVTIEIVDRSTKQITVGRFYETPDEKRRYTAVTGIGLSAEELLKAGNHLAGGSQGQLERKPSSNDKKPRKGEIENIDHGLDGIVKRGEWLRKATGKASVATL